MLTPRHLCTIGIGVLLGWLTPALGQDSPNRQAAMQEAMRLMMPGEGHKPLAAMAGRWGGKLKIWSSAAPTQPPMESTSESESKLILGGRYLQAQAKGTMMGMPMERVSIIGFDNLTKTYTQVFFSNLETSTNIATGDFDAASRTLTLRGEFRDSQGPYPFKNVIRFVSDDQHIFESYRVYPDGREVKLVEEVSTRIK